MANVAESNTWDAGIYQIENTDPVQGGPTGIDNLQAKGLANRTSWLKNVLTLLMNGTTLFKAKLDDGSTFEGTYTGPQQSNTELANTQFVQDVTGFRRTRKNAIINGDMGINQRQGSPYTLTQNTQVATLDRWLAILTGGTRSAVIGIDYTAQRTNAPEAPACMTIVLGAAAGTVTIKQRIENMYIFNGQAATLSFMMSLGAAVDFNVMIRVFDSTAAIGSNTPKATQTILVNGTSGVAQYKIPLTMATLTSADGSVSDNGNCVEISFVFAATAAMNAWLTFVQFESGNGTKYDRRTRLDEEQDCMRFYERVRVQEQFYTSTSSPKFWIRRTYAHKRVQPRINVLSISYDSLQLFAAINVDQDTFHQELQPAGTQSEGVAKYREFHGTVEVDAEI